MEERGPAQTSTHEENHSANFNPSGQLNQPPISSGEHGSTQISKEICEGNTLIQTFQEQPQFSHLEPLLSQEGKATEEQQAQLLVQVIDRLYSQQSKSQMEVSYPQPSLELIYDFNDMLVKDDQDQSLVQSLAESLVEQTNNDQEQCEFIYVESLQRMNVELFEPLHAVVEVNSNQQMAMEQYNQNETNPQLIQNPVHPIQEDQRQPIPEVFLEAPTQLLISSAHNDSIMRNETIFEQPTYHTLFTHPSQGKIQRSFDEEAQLSAVYVPETISEHVGSTNIKSSSKKYEQLDVERHKHHCSEKIQNNHNSEEAQQTQIPTQFDNSAPDNSAPDNSYTFDNRHQQQHQQRFEIVEPKKLEREFESTISKEFNKIQNAVGTFHIEGLFQAYSLNQQIVAQQVPYDAQIPKYRENMIMEIKNEPSNKSEEMEIIIEPPMDVSIEARQETFAQTETDFPSFSKLQDNINSLSSQLKLRIATERDETIIKQIISLAVEYLFTDASHHSFEASLSKYIKLRLSPEPTHPIGEILLQNGVILSAIVQSQTRDTPNPAMRQFLFKMMSSNYNILVNKQLMESMARKADEDYAIYEDRHRNSLQLSRKVGVPIIRDSMERKQELGLHSRCIEIKEGNYLVFNSRLKEDVLKDSMDRMDRIVDNLQEINRKVERSIDKYHSPMRATQAVQAQEVSIPKQTKSAQTESASPLKDDEVRVAVKEEKGDPLHEKYLKLQGKRRRSVIQEPIEEESEPKRSTRLSSSKLEGERKERRVEFLNASETDSHDLSQALPQSAKKGKKSVKLNEKSASKRKGKRTAKKSGK